MPIPFNPSSPEAQHTLRCGKKVIAISRQMGDVLSDLNQPGYVLTPDQSARYDRLLVEYRKASEDYSEAEAVHPFVNSDTE